MTAAQEMPVAIRDGEFKDDSPVRTVEKIKSILSSRGIVTRETWGVTQVPYCHTLSVRVEGTTFSVNGKGLTREFALASGYGELMERLQLGYLGSQEVQKDGNHGLILDGIKESVSAAGLYSANPERYRALADRFFAVTGKTVEPREILEQYADQNGSVEALPFQNLTTGQPELFPAALSRAAYSANGCAAGNTMEEAMVQAISEILERRHHTRIITEGLTPPDFPEDMLEQFPAAMEIIRFVRSAGYRVLVKDCSLGTNYPVVCVCFIHKKTGRYHTHFGAYPVFEIALERALTETFQGRNLDNFASFDNFSFPGKDGQSLAALANELTKGTWEKQPGFFTGTPPYPCNRNVGFTGRSNRELLEQCLDFFRQQGREVLMRDCSTMGFPTCQILVPGYSEIFVHRISRKEDDHRYAAFAARALRDPAGASLEDWMGLLMHTAQMSRFTRNISNVHGFLAGARLSAQISPAEDNALLGASLAYVNWGLGRHSAARPYLDAVIPGKNEEDTAFLICLKRYLDLKANGCGPEEIQRLLELFHGEIAEKLLGCLARRENPLEKFVLRCDGVCPEDCLLYGKCCQKQVEELARRIAGN